MNRRPVRVRINFAPTSTSIKSPASDGFQTFTVLYRFCCTCIQDGHDTRSTNHRRLRPPHNPFKLKTVQHTDNIYNGRVERTNKLRGAGGVYIYILIYIHLISCYESYFNRTGTMNGIWSALKICATDAVAHWVQTLNCSKPRSTCRDSGRAERTNRIQRCAGPTVYS